MPHVQQLDVSQAALVVIDVQEKMLGATGSDPLDNLRRHITKLVRTAALLNVPVICTEQYPKGLGGTDGAIKDALPDSAAYFEKTTMSCWRDAPFKAALQATNREHIILVGVETHVCVLQTALDMTKVDYDVFVSVDACGSRFENDKAVAIERMRHAGIVVSTTESLMFEMIGRCDHPQFKSFLEIVKS